MSKIPCKVCPKCGLYHDLSVKFCTVCSADLSSVAAELVETETIPSDKRGMINTNLKFYVQKCICQTLNFTLDANAPVTACSKCGGIRVAMIKPVEYKEEPETAPAASVEAPAKKTSDFVAIADKIKETTPESESEESVPADAVTAKEETPEAAPAWGDLLGTPRVTSVTLTCTTNPAATFTAKGVEGEKHLFGRYSVLGEYMQHDPQIGSEHCYVYYANGNWYVMNKKASNGTFLNGELMDDNTAYLLRDGALLKLGHRQDSFTFRITIR